MTHDEFVIAYEKHDDQHDGWVALVIGPTGIEDASRREYARLKAREILFPERYRNIRLLKQTNYVSDWEEVG